jgi:hypothetical protein
LKQKILNIAKNLFSLTLISSYLLIFVYNILPDSHHCNHSEINKCELILINQNIAFSETSKISEKNDFCLACHILTFLSNANPVSKIEFKHIIGLNNLSYFELESKFVLNSFSEITLRGPPAIS